MFVLGSNAAGGYNLTDSVRFRSSASAYLSRTPSSASNRKTWTLSVWFKLGQLPTADNYLYHSVSDGGANQIWMYFNSSSSNALTFGVRINSSNYQITLSQLQRDPSAWYHLVYAIDTTQATASNRVKIYFNGEQVTSFQSSNYPPLNADTSTNNTGVHSLGSNTSGALNFDGYMTEVNFIDGQQLTPSDFGEYDDTTGVWKPKRYSGSRGTNGFYLPMKATTQASGFNTVLYTGTGSTQNITNVGFQPDLVWLKARSTTTPNNVFDSVRGATKYIQTNTTNAENSFASSLTSFDTDGFTLGGLNGINANNVDYVAWCFEGGGTAVTNTNGTITSSVSANTAKGFSVLTYTGNGVLSTIGHGLSSAPDMIITKRLDAVDGWFTYHSALGKDEYLNLSSTSASGTTLPNYWGTSEPTSTVYGVNTYGGTNTNGGSFVSYCFSEVSGFSKFGSYTGTGSAGNSITGLGFRPAWIMFKRTDTTSNWTIHDITRDPSNEGTKRLYPNLSNAEQTVTGDINFDSDGFTLNNTGGDSNAAGGTYIYMAFADTRDYQWNFDASGNKNNWTPVNINSYVSSDTTYDIMSDVPTLTDEDTANFATLNPLNPATNQNISQGNLRTLGNAINHVGVIPTILPKTGKWYIEFDITTANTGGFGFTNIATPITSFPGASTGYWWIYGALTTGYAIHNQTSFASYTDTRFNTGNLGQMALDFDNGKVWVGSNNVWINATNGTNGNPSTGANPTWTMTTGVQYYPFWEHANSTTEFNLNFGQRPFAYTPPTGFKKLNTYNLPDSAIKDGSKYFNATTYSGTSATNTITNSGSMQPDMLWIKSRSLGAGGNHMLVDSVRGVGTGTSTKEIYPNLTNAEASSNSVTSLNSNGFTLTAAAGDERYNKSGETYVGWQWRASNSTAVSNTDGDIASTVSANPTSGFSVVTWTGTSSAGYVGHGLGVTPEVVLCKARDTTTSFDNWYCYFKELGAANKIILDRSDAASATSTWDSTSPNSTGFYLRNSVMNLSPYRFVGYVFAPVEGFSKFGSYTGNGSTNGPFVYTGFRPAFVIIKRTSNTGNWCTFDNKRDGYNANDNYLYPNTSDAEVTSGGLIMDMLSNGFKCRSSQAGFNASGDNIIYMAFAENPFKNSLAR